MPRGRILYIDDDAGLCRLTTRALERIGYRIETAPDGAAGVAMAAAGGYDAIAVDHYMPGMDGLQTLAALLAQEAPPPVVYVTGSEESRIAVAALKAGAEDYVVKTIGEDFFALLDSALSQAVTRRRLTEAKRVADAELIETNARLEALLKEVNHRVANSLQLVSALVHLQSAATAEPVARDALADTQRRIAAIAQVHKRLYVGNAVDSVELDGYLAALLDELQDSWSSPEAQRPIRFTGKPVRMTTDRAVSLGVIVNELVSNACKYAYPTDRSGEIRVTLARDGADGFRLVVEDDGCGMAPGGPARGTGVGTRVIGAMARSLRAALSQDEGHDGVRMVLTGPL